MDKKADDHNEQAHTKVPGLLKTLAGAGLQANPRGGWTTAEPHKCAEAQPSNEERAASAKWADEHSDGQEAAVVHNGVDPVTEGCTARSAQQVKDRIAGLIDRGCGDQEPRDHQAELDEWFETLAKLVGVDEAINTIVSICGAKLNGGISDADRSVMHGWVRTICKKTGISLSQVGKRNRGKKGKGRVGLKSPNG